MSKLEGIQCDKCGCFIPPSTYFFEINDGSFIPVFDNRKEAQCGKKIDGDYCIKCMIEITKTLGGSEENSNE